MGRLTIRGFDFNSDYVASNLQSYPIAVALKRLQSYEDILFDANGMELCSAECLTELVEAAQKRQEAESKGLNPAGEYAVKFAENHGISISEALERPMVKARFAFFADTGM